MFALSPALAVAGYLDYTDKNHATIYKTSVAELPLEYDGSTETLGAFIQHLKDRATAANWMGTLRIAKTGTTYQLLDHFGILTVEDIKNHAITYIGTQTRDAQNSFMMHQCLAASLTEEIKVKVETLRENYTIGDVCDGPLYFKALIQTVTVDTRATTTNIRTKLMQLSTYIADVDYDVTAFNTEVKVWQLQLISRGEQAGPDLLINLFQAYVVVPDQEFKRYMTRMYDDYKDERTDYTVNQLLTTAKNKYQELNDAGTWRAKSAHEKKLVAMAANIADLERQNKELQHTAAAVAAGTKEPPANNSSPNTKGKDRKYPAWKYVAPSSGDKQTKEVGNKTYHWCPHHKLWSLHKPTECRLAKSNSDGGTPPASGPRTTPGLQLNSHLAALAQTDTEDDW